MEKRAQAAMEFLMTYGWAILVVLGAIAALAFFGVLSPDRFLPEKCILPSGIACLDSTATTAGVSLVVQNAGGFDMTGVIVSADGDCAGAATPASTALNNGDRQTFTIACALTSGQTVKGTLNVGYTNADTGLAHNATGEIVKSVP